MAKLTLNDITSGFQSNTAVNTNNALIEAALENTLSRDGTGPNQMGADLDMNSNAILNASGLSINGVTVVPTGTTTVLASGMVFTPAGNISSVTVQNAIEELDTEKAPLLSPNLVTPNLGTPSAGDLSNCTNISGAEVTGTVATSNNSNNLGGISASSYLQIANQSKTENILPNTNWQIWSGLVPQTLVKEDGSGAQTAISCTGFDVVSNTPTFYTTNTRDLKVGDLVEITGGSFKWNYSGVAGTPPTTCIRIAGLVPNTSFIGQAPFGGVSPAVSVAVTATPLMPGNTGALSNGQSADGWSQSITLAAWPDDFSSNSYPGAIRVLGIRKGAVAEENHYYTCPSNQVKRYKGRTLTFGTNVMQKVQGGSGTWRIGIYDNVNGWRYSSAAGVSSGNYQFMSVTAAISASASTIYIGLFLSGTTGDVYYEALPTCVVGSYLSQANCGQNMEETLRAVNHWNPPMLTPLAITISAVYSLGSGLYGFLGQDLEALSMGVCHKSVHAVKCKIEFNTPTVGAHILTSTGYNTMTTTTFGPQTVTQVANVVNVGQGMLPLSTDGTFSLFTNVSGLVITNATFDFDTVVLNSSEIAN